MRGNEFLEKMELIDPAYVEQADKMPKQKKNSIKRWGAIAACLCLAFGLAIPALAASIPYVYDALYAISPATAQFFKPVALSCEDNGIRMEVVAAYIHQDTAEIYISMQDLQGKRVDETMDLFDSYQINTPFDCTGHCELSGFDPDTQTATFLITIKQWNKQNIIGDKLTFSIREFLANKKTYEGILDGVSLDNIEQNAMTQTVSPRGLSGTDLVDRYQDSAAEGVTVLKPAESLLSPVSGVTVTGMGYVDGSFHVQVYYEDIHKTDNHGEVALINSQTGERIPCYGTIAFFDEERKGSYEDYIFTGIAAEKIHEYELYGTFVTSSGPVKGNWSVTFPLENTGGQ